LEEGLRRAETLLEETSKPCGRDWVFPAPETAQELQKAVYDDNGDPIRDPGAPKDCSGVTAAEFYQCGLFSHLEIGTARDPSIQRPLFDQLVDTFRPGLWKGPLAVVVDKYTYSSAETAAGMLQDWAGAVVIGEPTAGAGAGNFFSFEPIDLPVSGLQLFLPDATAWRRDGRNYREGVTPDIRVWWYREDAWDVRARKLGAQLRAMNLRPDA
jgi:hypothetical protein